MACGGSQQYTIDFPSEVLGNIDVNVNLITNVAGTTTVGVTTMCGRVNLYDTYADAMAKAGAWDVKTSAGASVTPSGVTKDATNKGWAIAHSNTGVTTFALVSPATLAGLTPAVGGNGNSGYKSDILSVTVPSS